MPKITLFLALYLLLFVQLKAQSYNSLSEAFAHKEEAKILDLSKQNLGNLDDPLDELLQLKHLNLSENNLSFIHYPHFRKYKELEWIDVSHNELDNLSIHHFLYPPNIKYLNLSYNPIDHLYGIRRKSIYLFDVEIRYSNRVVPTPSLEKLIVKHTKLMAVNDELSVLPNLKYLDLSHNEIVFVDGTTLFNLKELDSLILSHNNFTTLFSKNSIAAHKLSYIDISHNPRLVAIDQLFNQFPNLRHINASYLGAGSYKNMRFGLVSSKKFYKNSPVKTLLLTHSHLKSVPKAMGYMENLEYLDLSHNELQSLPKSFKRLKKLKKLDLRGNPFLEKEKENCRKYLPDCEILF